MPTPELERLAQQTQLRTAALQLPGSPAPHSLTDLYIEPVLASASGEKLSPEAALTRSPAVVIVGPPGSGKTTLLQRLAWTQAVDYLAGKNKRCPVFLQARSAVDLIRTLDLPMLIAESFAGNYSPRLDSALLASWIANDLVSLFIDGLDEIGRAEDREHLFRAIQAARDAFPHLHLIVSSRPIAISGWLSSFSFFELQSFADSAVLDYIRRFTREAPDLAERFTETLTQNDQLRELAKSPLLLTLLWQIFRAKGQLPTSRSFIYADITEFLLSRWDQVRGVAREAEPSPRQLQLILQRCALYLFERSSYQITKEDVVRLIFNTVASWSLDRVDRPDASRVLTAIVDSGLFREFGADVYGFVHLSFLEYFAARALVEEEKLLSILGRPNSREIILFASGLLTDVGPLVEAIVARGDLLLAAACLSNGRRKNPQLAFYVIQEIRKEVGEPFVTLLASAYAGFPERPPTTKDQPTPKATPSKPEPPDIYTELSRKWRLATQDKLSSVRKGRLLEDFAKAFFGTLFVVVESNLYTENGEIDVLLENRGTSPFWLEFGSHVLIECKNWGSHVPLDEIGLVGFKANAFGIRLAFMLTKSGVTKDAKRTVRNQAASLTTLVVPLASDEIESALLGREDLEEFLKGRIRKVKFLVK